MVRNVQGHSMMPILPPNTLIVGLRRFRKVSPGDVIIFEHEGKEKIKRIQEIRGSELFVVGDHTDASTDSRHFGWVDVSAIKAKVIIPRNIRQLES